ncbi:unnamed protein product [Sphagnum jensenii]
MPLTPSLPTWVAWNNANFTSPTGLTDSATGQPIAAGGLNLGAYFNATNQEAGQASYAVNGILYGGRYRLIQVDSGATAANVKTGTVGYLRAGGGTGAVKSVVITNAGTGATAGTYQINANAGFGGQGAVISVTVAGGAITAVSVVNGGYNYNSVPTFSLTATGTTGGAVAAQLDTSINVVTSQDQVGTTAIAVRPVVFLNAITPGNYGFIQELGIATVLGGATLTSATSAAFVNVAANGVVNTTLATGSPIGATIGTAIDLPVVNNLFKALLGYACTDVQE